MFDCICSRLLKTDGCGRISISIASVRNSRQRPNVTAQKSFWNLKALAVYLKAFQRNSRTTFQLILTASGHFLAVTSAVWSKRLSSLIDGMCRWRKESQKKRLSHRVSVRDRVRAGLESWFFTCIPNRVTFFRYSVSVSPPHIYAHGRILFEQVALLHFNPF